MLRFLGLCLGAMLGVSMSCTFSEPGEFADHGNGPIPGINAEQDGPEQVVKVLGRPSARASGWWKDEHQFDIEFKVWYYKGVGRVIFYPEMDRVYTTEADKNQGGSSN
jgi:hypothetical protein